MNLWSFLIIFVSNKLFLSTHERKLADQNKYRKEQVNRVQVVREPTRDKSREVRNISQYFARENEISAGSTETLRQLRSQRWITERVYVHKQTSFSLYLTRFRKTLLKKNLFTENQWFKKYILTCKHGSIINIYIFDNLNDKW